MDPLHWPEGVPVICGGNQPELGLANGDLGVKLGSGEQSRVLFRVMAADGQPQIRRLHPARLTSLEPALALTIHRAQGSEADRVTVLWPPLQEDNIAIEWASRTTGSGRLQNVSTFLTVRPGSSAAICERSEGHCAPRESDAERLRNGHQK